MSFARALRVAATGAAVALVVGTLTTTAAEARPPTKPGGVTGVAAVVTAHPTSYDVAATWNAVTGATSYKVSLTKGGATLASTSVTTTSWSPTVTTGPGTASLSVRAVITKRAGKPTTISVPLPDVTAPTGAFHATWDNNTGVATVAVTTPASDNSGGAVTASIDWNDGSPAQAWTMAADVTHTYPKTAARYVPTVTLKDASNNSNPVEVNAVVMNDSVAPTGAFTVSTGSAWAKLSTVTVTQQGDLSDNWSPADHIARSVDWGDGTTTDWTTSDPATHVYAAAGDYTPTVTITDEASNAAAVPTSLVTVTADLVAPVVKLTLPRSKHSVRAFRTLRGKVTDAGTGVKSVTLKAVEKRGRAWYGYNAKTKKWVKAASKARAFAVARALRPVPTATHTWSAALRGLTKGTLVWKVAASDLVGNTSVPLSHQAALTKR
jgi:hypothetical protein